MSTAYGISGTLDSLQSFSKQLELESLNHQCELERLKNEHSREILALEIEFHAWRESNKVAHDLTVQALTLEIQQQAELISELSGYRA